MKGEESQQREFYMSGDENCSVSATRVSQSVVGSSYLVAGEVLDLHFGSSLSLLA